MSTPLQSETLIPKSEQKKDKGRNMMLKNVKMRMDLDWLAATSVCWYEKLFPCLCFMSMSFSNC